MDKIFSIAPVNALRFVDTSKEYPPRYYTRPFDEEFFTQSIRDFEEKECYFQKYAKVDATKVQILSELDNITAKVFDYATGIKKYDLLVTQPPVTLENPDLKVFEIDVDFSPWDVGKYYIVITANNGLRDYDYVSEPIFVADYWDNTALYEYRHSENNFSSIFYEGFYFSFRVEAIVTEYTPLSDDTLYNDQIRNSTLLDSVPYDQFKLKIGGSKGVPEWVLKKLNIILACDEVRIDGRFYTKAEGAKWEDNRQENYPLLGASINITPVENSFLERINTVDGDTPEGGGGGVELSKNFLQVTADIEITDLFKKYIILEKLQVIKYSPGPATIKVGTTFGGSELRQFNLAATDIVSVLRLEKGFDSDKTVYISGLAGGQFDLNVIYDDPFAIGGGGSGTTAAFPVGMTILYEEPEPGDFEKDFELSTGLGVIGRDYEGWAICDGRNGTSDRQGRVPVGLNLEANTRFSEIGGIGGLEKVALTIEEMPAHDHDTAKANPTSLDGPPRYDAAVPGAGKTGKTGGLPDGSTKAHENMPPYLVSVFIKKIE